MIVTLKGEKMQIFVKVDSVEEEGKDGYDVGLQIQNMIQSGKVIAGGAFTDSQGGYMVVDVDTPDELFQLISTDFLSTCHIETHPLLSYDKFDEFFERMEA
ncbi:MAG: hypothetical protein UT63_C0009G0006 [Candidatus Gottesmanbacteria bacterium GW2011_GWC2_39_8]|uniref:Muconolactone isomerase domain-containing protein n=1 Tax=Candidatus Gottesmanbacteria bacterium GW2011_GWC2_39_8 TaxID=1618450 RepID=A0A0G0Q9G8_9BACT|nr:MAG: hypothetical protein UT63_C0009G0006 [Candidatus Gottesmanbacteria bacterium GW2011_GWC2_39_8]